MQYCNDPRFFRTCIPEEHVLRKYVLLIFIITERRKRREGMGPYAHIIRGRERDLRYTAPAGVIRICDSEMLLYIITFMNRPSSRILPLIGRSTTDEMSSCCLCIAIYNRGPRRGRRVRSDSSWEEPDGRYRWHNAMRRNPLPPSCLSTNSPQTDSGLIIIRLDTSRAVGRRSAVQRSLFLGRACRKPRFSFGGS